MIVAYIDETGNDANSSVFAMATILLSHKSAYYFGNDWQALLEQHGVSAFHATTFHRRVGEFQWEDYRHNGFKDAVVQLINRWEIKHSAVLVANDDYQRSFVHTGFHKIILPATRSWKKPYLQAFVGTVHALREYATHQPEGIYITPVFDNCQEFIGQAKADYRERNKDGVLGEMLVSNTRQHIQLQAADFVAWEYRVSAQRFMKTGNREAGPTLAALLEHGFGAKMWGFEDLDYLRKRVEAIHNKLDPESVPAPVRQTK
jgi:hypothetical protein